MSELDEKDSVSPAITQSITKPHHCHEDKTLRRKEKLSGKASFSSGTREIAKARSWSDRYGAFVERGVSGKRRNP